MRSKSSRRPLAEDAESGAGSAVLGDFGIAWTFAVLNRAFRLDGESGRGTDWVWGNELLAPEYCAWCLKDGRAEDQFDGSAARVPQARADAILGARAAHDYT